MVFELNRMFPGSGVGRGLHEAGTPSRATERFRARSAGGDDEVMPLHRDFLRSCSMECRQVAAWNGIDRLSMALTGSGIRERIGVSAGKTTMSRLQGWVDFAIFSEMG